MSSLAPAEPKVTTNAVVMTVNNWVERVMHENAFSHGIPFQIPLPTVLRVTDDRNYLVTT